MDYEVILTHPAKVQLDHIVDYLLFELENAQAASSVMEDANNGSVYRTKQGGLI